MGGKARNRGKNSPKPRRTSKPPADAKLPAPNETPRRSAQLITPEELNNAVASITDQKNQQQPLTRSGNATHDWSDIDEDLESSSNSGDAETAEGGQPEGSRNNPSLPKPQETQHTQNNKDTGLSSEETTSESVSSQLHNNPNQQDNLTRDSSRQGSPGHTSKTLSAPGIRPHPGIQQHYNEDDRREIGSPQRDNPKPINVFIKAKDGNIGKLHRATIARTLTQANLDFSYLVPAGMDKVKVRCDTQSQAEHIISSPALAARNWMAYLPVSQTTTLGIIRDLPEETTPEEILEHYQTSNNQPIMEAIRQNKKVADKWIPSNTWRIRVLGDSLPKTVIGYKVLYRVSLFIPPVEQCQKCFRYGHPTKACRSQPICPKCAEPQHGDSPCRNQEQICIFCKSTDHTATKRDNCPRWQNEKQVKKVMAQQRISYAEATRNVRPAQHQSGDIHINQRQTTSQDFNQEPNSLVHPKDLQQEFQKERPTQHHPKQHGSRQTNISYIPISEEFIKSLAKLLSSICETFFISKMVGEPEKHPPRKMEETIEKMVADHLQQYSREYGRL